MVIRLIDKASGAPVVTCTLQKVSVGKKVGLEDIVNSLMVADVDVFSMNSTYKILVSRIDIHAGGLVWRLAPEEIEFSDEDDLDPDDELYGADDDYSHDTWENPDGDSNRFS